MGSYYSSNPKFYVGIDCIIFGFNEGELNLLLLKRNFEPAMGNWSLMGGFVQESESVDVPNTKPCIFSALGASVIRLTAITTIIQNRNIQPQKNNQFRS